MRSGSAPPSCSSSAAFPNRTGNWACRCPDGIGVNDDAPDLGQGGNLEHGLSQDLLDDGGQSPGAGLALQGEGGHRLNGGIGQLELDAVETEEVLVLGDQRVLGLGMTRTSSRTPRS